MPTKMYDQPLPDPSTSSQLSCACRSFIHSREALLLHWAIRQLILFPFSFETPFFHPALVLRFCFRPVSDLISFRFQCRSFSVPQLGLTGEDSVGLTKEEVEELLASADADGNGVLDYDEFKVSTFRIRGK